MQNLVKVGMNESVVQIRREAGMIKGNVSIFLLKNILFEPSLDGWLFWFNCPLRQYFSLHRGASQREGEKSEKRS